MLNSSPKSSKPQVFYAVVLHDFSAERADELEAKRGDPISVVAQSNREWFVAKPIGRLGRPGLIPVTFVEIRDPATNLAIEDVDSLMDRGDLPKVEDWKRAMFNYKQNSIALGVIEDTHNREPVPNSPFASQFSPKDLLIKVQAPTPGSKAQYSNSDLQGRASTPDGLPEGILLQADVVSFHYEMDEYWFRVDATFQPYAPPGLKTLPPAKQLVLFRVYNDFYDFQVALLDTFPREAGRQPPHPRLLPYMPGPADDVDDTITASRRAELDEYVHRLCELNTQGARYVLESRVIREFLSLKPGDVENLAEPRVQELHALSESSGRSQEYLDIDEYGRDLRDNMGRLTVLDRDDEERSEGSEYEDEGYAASPQRRIHERERHPYNQTKHAADTQRSLRQQAHTKNHQRSGSASSLNRDQSPYAGSRSNSRSNSPRPERSRSPNGPRSPSRSAGNRVAPDDTNIISEYSRWPDSSTSISSVRPQGAPPIGRSRSHSNATNTPSISAGNQQTAFVKIKIFDRQADNLIAIRVHPRVTHTELMDKVQARLGGEVAKLRYRDSTSHTFMGLDGDEELREWLDGTDKHVLYAD
jgi:bud emergence protein 1